MFEPLDCIPDDPSAWKSRPKGSKLRAVASGLHQPRRQLIEFAKFIINAYLNGPETIEELVDEWINGV